MSTTKLLTSTACLALAVALGAVPAEASTTHRGTAMGDPPWATVATGLDNPRHLSLSGDTLYVAEAGTGGSGPCVEGAEGQACYGSSGAVTAVRRGAQHRVLTKLPSLAGEGGAQAIGPTDIAVDGHGRFVLTLGLGNPPDVRTHLPRSGRLMGTLVTGTLARSRVRHHRGWHSHATGGQHASRGHRSRHDRHRQHDHPRLSVLADLAAHEQAYDPDGAGPDSNPGGIVATRNGWAVVDAGANTLLTVSRHGRVTTRAVFDSPGTAPAPFPPFDEVEMQAVPTSVTVGPDGALYVSELTGFPFAPDAARIHRISRSGQHSVYATGLTNVTDLAWHRGTLYAVELATDGLLSAEGLPMGSLLAVNPDGNHRTVVDGLPAPYGVAFGHDTAYVTTCAVCSDDGAVVALPLRHRH